MSKDPGKIRLINTKAHALYDYSVGAALMLSPFLLDGDSNLGSQKILFVVAVFFWLTAALSKFEFAALPVIPLWLHYLIDLFLGAFLAASPWLFGFSEEVFKPHLVIGLSVIVVSLLSDRVLEREVRLILSKGRGKKPAKRKRSTGFVTPVLKLVVDPFYASMAKEFKKQG